MSLASADSYLSDDDADQLVYAINAGGGSTDRSTVQANFASGATISSVKLQQLAILAAYIKAHHT